MIGVDLQETKRPDKFCDDRVTIVQVGAGGGRAGVAEQCAALQWRCVWLGRWLMLIAMASLPPLTRFYDVYDGTGFTVHLCRRMRGSWGPSFGRHTRPAALTPCSQTCERGERAGDAATLAGGITVPPLPIASVTSCVRHYYTLFRALHACTAWFHASRCHFTLGNSVADAYKSLELARTAWTIATGAAGLAVAMPGSLPAVCLFVLGGCTTGLPTSKPPVQLLTPPSCICLLSDAGGEEAESLDPNMPWGRGVLKPGGSLVMKLLQGTGERPGCSASYEFAA